MMLENIHSPEDVKKLPAAKLPQLAEEIRKEIISVTSQKGGHVSPNLGVIELSIALHRVFETPKDKIIFDVSHQCYTHKLLTGRNNERFQNLRQTGGISGFCNRGESEHDAFGAGHAGTALSAALGFAAARDRNQTDENVIAVVGDAALTNGVSLEALNNISTTTKKMIVVLNDNKMSIAKNVGAISKHLNNIITNPYYNRLYNDMNEFLKKLAGDSAAQANERLHQKMKSLVLPSSVFENVGMLYVGPIDGHDIPTLEKYLQYCKNANKPVILHIVTKKGKGLPAAENNPEKFHGATPYNIETGESLAKDKTIPNYQDVFGNALLKFAKKDEKIVGITAAMASGTGMSSLKKELPSQFYDVGIAEEHAAVFAAGLACSGIKPVVAIYSTFMQRAYDCAMHDVCLQKLPVVFCMDRAGLSPNDGATHHGLFDISFLRSLPNAVVMQPSNEDELTDMLWTSIQAKIPAFIRYPRGKAEGVKIKETPSMLEIGKANELRKSDGKICIWALGNMLSEAMTIADAIKVECGIEIGVVDARFIKP
ncbi:MAG: 1-deoxy-D-xylulose-5-phosphate synthase, partial [Opitutales bacterium]|nr:1-deoxy-D-xylulose-5-phosphate synthase [Opitutales bacterium]